MPLIRHGNFVNPSNQALPNMPSANAAPSTAPVQGDHLFGDVIGTIGTAMKLIFGGGAVWEARVQPYNPVLAALWRELKTRNFGHTGGGITADRSIVFQPDEHSHMFGGYSARLQWRLCEIVCTGHENHKEIRIIGGATPAWKRAVLADFDALMDHLVDYDALVSYLPNPGRRRNAVQAPVRHTAISLAEATRYTLENPGNRGAPQARDNLLPVLANYAMLRNSFAGLLMRFEGRPKTFDSKAAVADAWSLS